MIYPRGFRWSVDMKPIVKTDLCMHAHVGFLVRGEIDMEYTDGCVVEFKAPQVVAIDPGHDGWVVGTIAVLIEFDFEGNTIRGSACRRVTSTDAGAPHPALPLERDLNPQAPGEDGAAGPCRSGDAMRDAERRAHGQEYETAFDTDVGRIRGAGASAGPTFWYVAQQLRAEEHAGRTTFAAPAEPSRKTRAVQTVTGFDFDALAYK